MMLFAYASVLAVQAAVSAGKMPEVDRTFDVGSFERVESAGIDEIEVRSGGRTSVVAHGDPAIIRTLKIGAREGTLRVDRLPGHYQDSGVTLIVTMPRLNGVVLGGTRSFHAPIATGPRFAAEARGAGTITLDRINSAQTDLRITGTGAIHAKGFTPSLRLQVSAPTAVDLTELATRNLELTVSGSARVRARSTGAASIIVSGDGVADVIGTRDCHFVRSGAGRASCDGRALTAFR